MSTEPTTLEQVREYAKDLGKDHEEFIQAVIDMTYSLEYVQAELNQIKATGDVFAN